jgi:hypothetical protein
MHKTARVLLIASTLSLSACALLSEPKAPFAGRCPKADICFSEPTPQNAVVKLGAPVMVVTDTLFWSEGLAVSANDPNVRDVSITLDDHSGASGFSPFAPTITAYNGYTVVEVPVAASGSYYGVTSMTLASKYDPSIMKKVSITFTK